MVVTTAKRKVRPAEHSTCEKHGRTWGLPKRKKERKERKRKKKSSKTRANQEEKEHPEQRPDHGGHRDAYKFKYKGKPNLV